VLVGVLKRLGKSGRGRVGCPSDQERRYDKPRLDLAIRMAATGGSSAQVEWPGRHPERGQVQHLA
jgi:hypothetical protein